MDKRPNKERFDAGLKTRREVLGAQYVDKAMAGTDDFSAPFVELLNTYCWNDVWNRPGLDRKTRSMLNLAMLSALGKEHELKLHLNGALNNGLTKEQIREVLLQVAIYCGVPAAVVAFRCAKEVFKDRGGVSAVRTRRLRRPGPDGAADGRQPREGRLRAAQLRSERGRQLRLRRRGGARRRRVPHHAARRQGGARMRARRRAAEGHAGARHELIGPGGHALARRGSSPPGASAWSTRPCRAA